MKSPSSPVARYRNRVLTGFGAASLVALAHLFGITSGADAWAYDRLAGPAPASSEDRVAVVAIDERSLAELGRWPWSRRTHAELVKRLDAAGARGIGLNILLSEPALFDPEGDALLAQAIGRSGKVVLPVLAEAQGNDGASVELMPIPEFAAAAAALGHVDMTPDADGTTRDMFLRAGVGSPHWPSLALALSQLGRAPDPGADPPGARVPGAMVPSPDHWVRDYQVLVPVRQSTTEHAHLSYADVLRGRAPEGALRGRWVVVGMTAAGMQEGIAPPSADGTPNVSGADYQADALSALLAGTSVTPMSMPARIALSIFFVVLPLLVLGLRGLRPIWRAMLLAMVATPVVSWLLLKSAHLWYPPMSALLVLAIGSSILALGLVRQSRRQAESDPLTGLANRARFDEELDQELRTARKSGQPLSLLVVDVDHFKRLNDGMGQPTGDEVLRALSTVLRGRARRPRDLVARLGSDEFALLLPETTPQAAAAIATTIHVDLANLSTRSGSQVPLPPFTASIGIHTTKGEDENAQDVFELADHALYQAKQAGRNRSFSHTGDRPLR